MLAWYEEAKENASDCIALRRRLHEYPEPSQKEFLTTAFIKEELEKAGICLMNFPNLQTGAVGEIKGEHPGGTVFLRADIDAIEQEERVDVSYRSKVPGLMHACGHDAHTAILLSTAKLLSKHKKGLHGRIRFLFQPAEELFPGGAQSLISAGALDAPDPVAIFGLHVDSSLSTGVIGGKKGVTYSQVVDFEIFVHGRGSHASRPDKGVDALVATAHIIVALQNLVSRQVSPHETAVLSIGTVNGGTRNNILAHPARMTGTIRAMRKEDGERYSSMAKKIVTCTAEAFGATAEIQFNPGYPPLINHPEMVEKGMKISGDLFGPENFFELQHHYLGGEDFSYYLECIPGAFFSPGVRNEAIGSTYPEHSPHFRIDENAFPFGVAFLCALAEQAPRGFE